MAGGIIDLRGEPKPITFLHVFSTFILILRDVAHPILLKNAGWPELGQVLCR